MLKHKRITTSVGLISLGQHNFALKISHGMVLPEGCTYYIRQGDALNLILTFPTASIAATVTKIGTGCCKQTRLFHVYASVSYR